MQLFVVTGERREENLSLQGKSINIKKERFDIKTEVKGGCLVSFEMDDPVAENALFNLHGEQSVAALKFLAVMSRAGSGIRRAAKIWRK